MFATQSKNKAETSAGGKPKRAEATTAGKDAPEQNPVWQSLALCAATVRPKLVVSQPDNPDEREADRTADRVMRMTEQTAQPKCEACATAGATCPACAGEQVRRAPEPQVRRACASCSTGGSHTHADEEEVPVRRKAERDAGPAEAGDRLAGQLGAGRPLEAHVRALFGP